MMIGGDNAREGRSMEMNLCNTIRFEVQYHSTGYRVVDSVSGERPEYFAGILEACAYARKIERESLADLND